MPTWDQPGANWPHYSFMANLALSGALWNFGHITLPWPFMAPIIIYGLKPYPAILGLAVQFFHIPNPQVFILVFGPGGVLLFPREFWAL